MIESTKSFWNLPCAHRRWRHDGHCALIHGYSRSFHFTFRSRNVDANGFVVDFGSLKWLKVWLEERFDHTLLIDPDDPLMSKFVELRDLGACNLVFPLYGAGMEGCARWVFEHTDSTLNRITAGNAWVHRVEARENDKNSAIYTDPLDR